MKFLLGYDGSNAAMDALKLAIKHAKVFGAGLHVIRSLTAGGEEMESKIKTAKDQLEFVEDYVKKAEVPCETHLMIRGLTPGEDLVRFAEDEKIDTIFIGVKRRSSLGKLLFGSNARHVILNAPCPVVSIR